MSTDLIPPEVRSRLAGLRLGARRALGGQGMGMHRSRNRGSGLEFAQYRGYEPGDEPRQIDWKLYARSDRLFVREAERESPVTVWILLDASASMAQRDLPSEATSSRLHAGKVLAACIAELALRQGDRFGFIGLQAQGLRVVPPGNGTRQRDQLLLSLHGLDAGGAFPHADRLGPIWERIGAGDIVIVISDWFDEAVIALAERLAAARREVLAIQLLTVAERDFPFDGGYRFHDPETGEELLGDGRALRDGFLQRFAEAQRGLRARLDGAGIRHCSHCLDQPLDQPLRALFGSAEAVARG